MEEMDFGESEKFGCSLTVNWTQVARTLKCPRPAKYRKAMILAFKEAGGCKRFATEREAAELKSYLEEVFCFDPVEIKISTRNPN